MSTGEIIAAVAVFGLAGVLLILAVRSFRERGFLLNNAWIYASAKERETMDKKPYYRQSAVVFCILSAVFAVIGLSLVLRESRITLLEIPLVLAAVIYACVSAARIRRQRKS